MKTTTGWLRMTREPVAKGRSVLATIDFSLGPQLSYALDLLRGFAAYIVLSGHTSEAVFDSKSHSSLGGWLWWVSTSFQHDGVVLFFALSGFLIGRTAIQTFLLEKRGAMSYVIDRATRIYVVFFPALVVGFLIDSVAMHILRPGSGYDYIAMRTNALKSSPKCSVESHSSG